MWFLPLSSASSIKWINSFACLYSSFLFENLFKELNSLRKEISKQENIAPYIIFSDMTLIEMAEKKPRNRWDMLKIKGIGNQKFKSYGERFLERINNYCMEERL